MIVRCHQQPSQRRALRSGHITALQQLEQEGAYRETLVAYDQHLGPNSVYLRPTDTGLVVLSLAHGTCASMIGVGAVGTSQHVIVKLPASTAFVARSVEGYLQKRARLRRASAEERFALQLMAQAFANGLRASGSGHLLRSSGVAPVSPRAHRHPRRLTGERQARGHRAQAIAQSDDRDSERRESLLMSLSRFGADAVEPLLQMRDELTEGWRRDDVLLALTEREGALPKDERIFAALCEFLPRNLDLGAELLEEYADPRALPLIEQAIERFVPDVDSLMSERELRSLLSAHRHLGGELPAPLHARVHVWFDAWDQTVPAPEPVRRTAPKLGRNDPCSCRSGKKFKKCCLGKQDVP